MIYIVRPPSTLINLKYKVGQSYSNTRWKYFKLFKFHKTNSYNNRKTFGNPNLVLVFWNIYTQYSSNICNIQYFPSNFLDIYIRLSVHYLHLFCVSRLIYIFCSKSKMLQNFFHLLFEITHYYYTWNDVRLN